MCITQKKLSYLSRLGDLEEFFGRSTSALSSIFLHMLNLIVQRFRSKLDFESNRLAPLLPSFSRATEEAGSPLEKCWGFIDGTVRLCARPVYFQQLVGLVDNGHKRVYSLKFHSIVTPDGLISHLFGPVEGRRHGCFLLRETKLREKISSNPRFTGYVIYGEPVFGSPIQRESTYHSSKGIQQENELSKERSGFQQGEELQGKEK